jgi:hypothetical protein
MLLAYGFRLAVDAVTRALVPWAETRPVDGDAVRERPQRRGERPAAAETG